MKTNRNLSGTYWKKTIKPILTLCLVVLVSLPSAQPLLSNYLGPNKRNSTTSIQDLYQSAKKSYQEQLYTESIDILTYMLSMHLSSNSEEALLIFSIDTYLQRGNKGDVAKAEEIIQSFKVRFPRSAYLAHTLYYQAIINMGQDNYFEASQLLVQATNQTSSKALFQRASIKLSQIFQDNLLSIPELENLLKNLKYNRELMAKALLSLGDVQVQQKFFKAAHYSYNTWLSYFSDLPWKGIIERRISDISDLANPNQVVLVMLPLTGTYKQVGLELYKGISLALENSPFWQRRQYQYKIINTKGNAIQAVQKLRKELRNHDVIGILGPAMSHVSTAVAIEMSNLSKSIPMITPTATTQGIANLGKNIFQTNVTTQFLGKSLAQYSWKCKGLQEYAIMAPNTPYGLEFANAFQQQVLSQGGSILATELYNPDKADHGRHFKVIKSRKARRLIAQDSSLLTRQVPELDKETNEIYYVSEPLSPKEQAEVLNAWAKDSSIELDGLLLVAQDVKEAEALYSQSLYHKLSTTILASPDWYDISLIQKQLLRTNKIIFNTDFLSPDSSDAWKRFEKLFRKNWEHSPQQTSVLGYDATQFFLLGLQKNSQDPVQGLQKISIFSGVRGDITMNSFEGINTTSYFVSVGKEKFEILKNCLE